MLIPSITFLALFILLSTATLAQALSLHHSVTDGRAGADLAGALTALQDERRLSVDFVTDPGGETRQALVEAARTTDETLAQLRQVRETLEGEGDEPEALALAFFGS
ncbi:nitrate- and nitrite sensing domain-containing protein, partial [Streptomyces sp. NPDC000931]|uniref:nitrate- and nitrite sensing domain-containing protein n=1 Tax=Streptomyces sp. NPDC000931 TaxID=3154372 RepID=UPI003331C7E8